MATPDTLDLVYLAGMAAVYLSIGLFVAYVRPLTWPKRLLGAAFALLAAQQASVLLEFLLPVPPGGSAVWDAFWEDLRFLRNFALLGFLWLYPAPPRRGSWEAWAMGGFAAFLVLDLGLWLFARGFLLQNPAWLVVLHGSGYGFVAMLSLAVGSGFSRMRALPAEDRAGVPFVLAAAGLFVFPLVGRYLVGLGALAAGHAPLALSVAAPFRGPCCHPGLLLVAANLLLPAAIAAHAARRDRAWAPVVLAGWGALGALALGLAPEDTPAAAVFPNAMAPVLLLYAVARHGALGIRGPGRGSALVLAAVLFVALFLLGQSFALLVAQDPLGVGLGLLGSLALGAFGAWAALPGLRWDAGLDEGSERRLGPYQTALAAELAAGADAETTRRKLLGLRRELGVTDTEHVLIESTLRRSGALGPPAMGLAEGQRFAGRYLVRRGLGPAGGGPAYLCRDERAGREVVVKMLQAPGPGAAAEGLGAVVREARALAAVRHPRVVALYDVEQVGDQAFLVMEFAEGGSLARRLERGPLEPAAWAALARDLLEGLEAVHGAGVVHRDVKPSNVLLDASGRAKLGDFGVARQPGLETTAGWVGSGEGAVGTVRYMSPEQARGRPATPASDLYGAAVTLYEAWTGRPYVALRPGETVAEAQLRVATAGGLDQPLRAPAPLRGWFRQALQPDPAQRFPGAAAMRGALDRALAGDRAPAGGRARPR